MNTEEVTLHDKTFKVFIHESKINEAIQRLSKQINEDYKDKNPLFLSILNGSFLFAAELFKNINGNAEISFIKLASYYGTGSTGTVNELIGLTEDITNRHLIIIEDIVDTGTTLDKIIALLNMRKAASIETATLLFKPDSYTKKHPVKYVGLTVGNEFLVGYGLDYNGLGRNLKDIYIIV